jgi:hypothetical protein
MLRLDYTHLKQMAERILDRSCNVERLTADVNYVC